MKELDVQMIALLFKRNFLCYIIILISYKYRLLNKKI